MGLYLQHGNNQAFHILCIHSWEGRDRKNPVIYWPDILAKSLSFRFEFHKFISTKQDKTKNGGEEQTKIIDL